MRGSHVIKTTIYALIVMPLFIIGASSCNKAPNKTDDELRAQALSLALKQRYQLYFEVYKSRIPRNPLLAEEVAKLGEPARLYALAQAQDASGAQFGAALAVLSEFEQNCSSQEYTSLMNTIREKSGSDGQRRALEDSVNMVCRHMPPKAERGYELR